MSDEKPALPAAPVPVWDSIPAELAQRQQWVLWKFEWDARRSAWLKVPYYVGGGRRSGDQGSDRDRQRLATLPVVRSAFERKQGLADAWSGIGFGFLPGDGLIGIDLDKHVDPATGEMSERCKKIIAAFHTFTEISPSGTGVHLYLKGHTQTAKSNDIGVEMFCERQYFTVTGRHVAGTPLEVSQADESAIRRMHATIQEAKEKRQAPASPPPSRSAQQAAGVGEGRNDFAHVNEQAMRALHVWVPALFGGREQRSPKGYRITSKALGRDLQEDISIHADGMDDGIMDWGVADMGDARGGRRSPIDLVMEWGPGTTKPAEALKWLAGVLGIVLQPPKPNRANERAPAGGDAVAPGAAETAAGDGGDADKPKKGKRKPSHDGELTALYDKLVWGKNSYMDCRPNVMYCLQLDPALAGLARYNTFTMAVDRSREAPWGREAGAWDEEDDMMLGEYLLQSHSLNINSKGTLRDGAVMAALQDKYNPIEELIRAEVWDGEQRLEHWLTKVYGIEERPYTRLIGKCFMMGLVNRAINPGCKFDYMLIIKGDQGLKKTSAWRAIAYPYYTDNAIRVGDKDSQLAQQMAWIVESAELESLNKAESTAIKQYLSAQEDWFRPPYGAQMVKSKRHFVNVGTTNADTFLRDATGDRRFWPLEVRQVNADALIEMRGQLLAEALHRLNAGERYWPDRDEEKTLIFPEQEPFKRSDPWEDLLDAYVNGNDGLHVNDPAPMRRQFFPRTELYQVLQIKPDRVDNAGQMDTRISNAMKSLGFKVHRESTGLRKRGFLRQPKDAVTPVLAAASAAQEAPHWPYDAPGEGDDLPI
ncbi:VapE domain-containing protein [Delftia tsuruhatensis]|uniref:VapE family protein n=1 Tax=Delftia tsuruhatensis TaxID=180282 RepID=A0AAX3STR3_9BURK|nr:VapE domain-containing protein [Delftia tsuruhatensis]WFF83335.1 VapE family protein [Delftia tsuruhatensis]